MLASDAKAWLRFVFCVVSCRCRYQPFRWVCLPTTCWPSVRPHPTFPAMMACGTACVPQRDRPAGTSRRCTRRQGTPASIASACTSGLLYIHECTTELHALMGCTRHVPEESSTRTGYMVEHQQPGMAGSVSCQYAVRCAVC